MRARKRTKGFVMQMRERGESKGGHAEVENQFSLISLDTGELLPASGRA